MKQNATLNKYEAYKPTDEFWLGNIPKHWDIKRLKHIFQEKRKVTNPELNSGSISFGKVVTKNDDKIPLSTKASYQEVLKGEYLINPLNLNYDLISLRIALSEIDVVVSSGYIVLQNHSKIDKNYYKWLLHRYDVAYMKLLGSGVRQTINFNHISNSLMPFPPLSEQAAIAVFLDDKTAKVDTAIAQKEQLIKLLQERKQIMIQEAVTKGVRALRLRSESELENGSTKSEAEMGSLSEVENAWTEPVEVKPSGVEWIGDIPAHWEVKRLKYVLKERSERSETGDEPLFMMSQVHGLVKRADFHEKAEVAQTSIGNKIVHRNDLVFNKLKAHLGVFFKSEIEEIGLVSPDYAVYYSNQKISDLKYLELLFRHPNYIHQFIIRATGIVEGLIRLYTSDLFEISIPIPPVKEQSEILNYIEKESTKIEKAVGLQKKQIKKLKEYKNTLIDSAVRGKVKVC
jgi:type I restriction enzyme S subunit